MKNPEQSALPVLVFARQPIPAWQLALYAVFYLFSIGVIGLTSYVPAQADLLLNLTLENGFYEIASAMLLVALCLHCLLAFLKHRKRQVAAILKIAWLAISCLAFLAAGEELSWGQHHLGFASGEFFQAHNLQKETNLHNLVPGHLFAGAINSTVYIAFIFGPTLIWFFPQITRFFGPLQPLVPVWMPSLHISLIMCFASTLIPYFLPTSTVSTGALLLALICLAFVIWRVELPNKLPYVIHWLAVLLAMLFFMLNTHVFSYYNMQAEVREFFIVLAGTFWVMGWSREVAEA